MVKKAKKEYELMLHWLAYTSQQGVIVVPPQLNKVLERDIKRYKRKYVFKRLYNRCWLYPVGKIYERYWRYGR